MTTEVVESDLDCTNSSRGVWLVKVPKYISQRWEKAPGNIDVGKLKITRNTNRKLDITFSLSEAVLAMDTKEAIPKEHKFVIGSVQQQTLGVFSRSTAASSATPVVAESDKLCLEGKVIQRAECRPIGNSTYMKLKMEGFRKSAVPTRTVKKLDDVVHVRPMSHHKNTFEPFRKRVEVKKVRDDREKVTAMLFAAFEKHQYYNIRDLVNITHQPITYLKEILGDLCNYSVKKPHRNMYELKPEYRHYESTSGTAAAAADDDDDDDDNNNNNNDDEMDGGADGGRHTSDADD